MPGKRMPATFMIGGVKRAGTTSLFEYLLQHPDVLAPAVAKGSRYFDVNFGRGVRWYRSHFPFERTAQRHERRTGRAPITGEASPYIVFHPLSPGRLAATHPDIRVILLLRDPVQRAWSHHRYEQERGYEPLAFHDALDAEPERLDGEVERMRADPTYISFSHRHWSYLARGRYAEQLRTLWSSVPRDRTLVLRSEDLFADPAGAMRRVTDFLDLGPFELSSYDVWKRTQPATVPEDVRARLDAYFRPWNEDLGSLLGSDFRWDRPAGR
jgi:hypothetical protein